VPTLQNRCPRYKVPTLQNRCPRYKVPTLPQVDRPEILLGVSPKP
jgi:hypothetical protein